MCGLCRISAIANCTSSGQRPSRRKVKGRAEAKRLYREHRPDAVVGFGGYPAFPSLLAASAMNIPTVLHEQNAVAGLAPAQAGTIVRTCVRERRNVAQHACPAQRRCRNAGLEEDRRPAVAGADDMQMLSADVEHHPGRRIPAHAVSSANELIESARSHDDC